MIDARDAHLNDICMKLCGTWSPKLGNTPAHCTWNAIAPVILPQLRVFSITLHAFRKAMGGSGMLSAAIEKTQWSTHALLEHSWRKVCCERVLSHCLCFHSSSSARHILCRAFPLYRATSVSRTRCVAVSPLSRSSRRGFQNRTLWSSTWMVFSEVTMAPGKSLARTSPDAGSLHPRRSSPWDTRGLLLVVSGCPANLRPRNIGAIGWCRCSVKCREHVSDEVHSFGTWPACALPKVQTTRALTRVPFVCVRVFYFLNFFCAQNFFRSLCMCNSRTLK